ncbi:MAG: hypothetical protein EOO10_13515 [Chitinophagaceae bacterium]|nr:MAG: hypothetical protein EOO10_13515 [Chitinophagaceae bacterium]
MSLTSTFTKRFLKRKIATLLLVTASVCAFATLGDDGGKKARLDNSSVLLPYSSKNFSLRSNYNYKGNNFFTSTEKKDFIMLNQVVTYQKGNAAYVLPLKKMPLMGKIKFSCAPQKP